MNWFFAVARVAGAAFPFSSPLVQLHAELESAETQRRLRELEDSIGALHPDIENLSAEIYSAMRRTDDTRLEFDNEFYERYSRPLAVLEQHGLVKGGHALRHRYRTGIRIANVSYVLYMCGRFEDPGKMDRLMDRVDSAPRGVWLNGHEIADELELPASAVRAVFQVYEANGYGRCSRTIGAIAYCSTT